MDGLRWTLSPPLDGPDTADIIQGVAMITLLAEEVSISDE